jgi:hypothetical protein
MKPFPNFSPDWNWGTPEGSREFDRHADRQMSLAEKLDWLEQAETLALLLEAQRQAGPPSATETSDQAPS